MEQCKELHMLRNSKYVWWKEIAGIFWFFLCSSDFGNCCDMLFVDDDRVTFPAKVREGAKQGDIKVKITGGTRCDFSVFVRGAK